jgi:hypothetical protein
MEKVYLVRYDTSTGEVIVSDDLSKAYEYGSHDATIADKNILNVPIAVTYQGNQCSLESSAVERTPTGGYVITFRIRPVFRETKEGEGAPAL